MEFSRWLILVGVLIMFGGFAVVGIVQTYDPENLKDDLDEEMFKVVMLGAGLMIIGGVVEIISERKKHFATTVKESK